MIVKWVHKPEDGWTKETLPEEGLLVLFHREDAKSLHGNTLNHLR